MRPVFNISLVATAGLLLLVRAFAVPQQKRAIHELSIVHPGDPQERDIPVVLEAYFDETGEPREYTTWVDSVICRDEKCQVVPVRLYFDPFGQYQRYETVKGKDLTKLDHEPFTAKDHAKLQSILLDKTSPLAEVTKEGLTGPKAQRGVDGVAGATLLTLKSTVVVGAGYTCYDLWHWANGEVPEIIARFSSQRFSERALRNLLKHEADRAVDFALRTLTARRIFDADTMEVVVACVETAGDVHVDAALAYLRAAAPHDAAYYDALTDLFKTGDSKKRVRLLNRLMEENTPVPSPVLDRFSQSLPGLETYQELHLFLALVTARDAASETIARNVAPLLQHTRFFVARRAFWYLENQELPADLTAQVDAFRKANEDRL